VKVVRCGGPPPFRPAGGCVAPRGESLGEGHPPPGRRMARWRRVGGMGGRAAFPQAAEWRRGRVLGGGPPSPRPPGGGVKGGPEGRAASPPAAGWRGAGGPWSRATSPPAARWRGRGSPGWRVASLSSGGLRGGPVRGSGARAAPSGRRLAGGGGPGGWAAPPPAYKAAPQSSILRTENESFSLWKSSRFYRPGGSFSLSSALCIFGMAALRTNLSSANGGRGEAWANVCKLLRPCLDGEHM